MISGGIIAGSAPQQSSVNGASNGSPVSRPSATAPVHACPFHGLPLRPRPDLQVPAPASAPRTLIKRGRHPGLDGMGCVSRFRAGPDLRSAPTRRRPDTAAGIALCGLACHGSSWGIGFTPATGLGISLLNGNALPEPATCASFHRTCVAQAPDALLSTSGTHTQLHAGSAQSPATSTAAASSSSEPMARADVDAPMARTSLHAAISRKSSTSSQGPPGLSLVVRGHHLPACWGSLLGDTPSSSSSSSEGPPPASSLLATPGPQSAANLGQYDSCQPKAPVAQPVPALTALRFDHAVYLPHLGVIPEVRFVSKSCI